MSNEVPMAGHGLVRLCFRSDINLRSPLKTMNNASLDQATSVSDVIITRAVLGAHFGSEHGYEYQSDMKSVSVTVLPDNSF